MRISEESELEAHHSRRETKILHFISLAVGLYKVSATSVNIYTASSETGVLPNIIYAKYEHRVADLL
jgi:hypothetical protein